MSEQVGVIRDLSAAHRSAQGGGIIQQTEAERTVRKMDQADDPSKRGPEEFKARLLKARRIHEERRSKPALPAPTADTKPALPAPVSDRGREPVTVDWTPPQSGA